jgi:lipoprotein NlpI
MKYFLLLLFTPFAFAHPLPEAELKAVTDEQKELVAKCDTILGKDEKSVAALSHRGDARLFLHDWKGARQDYEKMIAIDPAQDVPHWRLGIVYFVLGEYEKGAAQFAKYHAYDDHDRENGVWHFFCVAKQKGVEAARKELLEYKRFDRHPFPDVYEMLAGKCTPAELQKRQDARAGEGKRLEQQQFFADLYLGMYAWLEKRPEDAKKHLEAATANTWGRNESDRTYMWQTARCLWEEWCKPVEAKPK